PAGFPIDPPGAHGSVEPETVVDPDVVLPIVEERNPLLEAFAEVDVLQEDIRIRGERLDRGDEAPGSEVVAEDQDRIGHKSLVGVDSGVAVGVIYVQLSG